jgi:hypothetical protein
LSTYKLAAPGRTVGTLTYDGLAAVAGRTGPAPPSSRIAVRVADRDTDRRRDVDVLAADETDLGDPAGFSPIGIAAPMAVAEGVTTTLGASPPRLTGDLCLRITLRERPRPMGFCNRYVTEAAAAGGFFGVGNGVAIGAALDVADALSVIESFEAAEVHVERVDARVGVRRGAMLAQLRGVRMPRRVRPNQRVRVTLRLEGADGDAGRRSFAMRIPARLERGSRRLTFVGTDADQLGGDEDFLGLSARPARRTRATMAARRAPMAARRAPRRKPPVERLAAQVEKLRRYDGIRLRLGRGKAIEVFRDRELRIAGRASIDVRVLRPSRGGRD